MGTSFKEEQQYTQCSRTVMDTIADPDIRFDAEGVCHYFHEYQAAAREHLLPEPQRTQKLHRLLDQIRKAGKGRPYDCLIGVSGGVDSSYLAYMVKQWGLRPLAVHLDNGWNSELAVKNIENIVNKLGFDLFTLVIDWQEFRDIQLAYLKASVVDIEVVSDHAIFSTMYKLANQYKIPYILSGTNIVTEYIMPPSWLYNKMDFENLRDIHDQYGTIKRKTYPAYTFAKSIYYSAVLKLAFQSVLNLLDYNKKAAKETITRELEWRDYGGKHYESVFTKFYQAFILPEKFGIDKRKAHLSTLICSGQMDREEALNELARPLYQPEELKLEKEYVLKKLGLTETAFQEIMARPRRQHGEFKSDLPRKKRYMDLMIKTAPVRHFFRKKL
jgi:N-acetyl sugar amidotransferase